MKKMVKAKPEPKKVAVEHVKLSALTKQQILSSFVDELVQKKLISTKKPSRLDSSAVNTNLHY